MKKLAVFGATGSIGRAALEIVKSYPERFQVLGISAKTNLNLLKNLAQKFKVPYLVVENEELAKKLKASLNYSAEVLWGDRGLKELSILPEIDLLLIGISGIKGLIPTYYGLKKGKIVALANKESLVCAGGLLKKIAKQTGGKIIPVDSEHSSLFQLLNKEPFSNIEKIFLTASGGPFYKKPIREFVNITPEVAIKHPTWKMGVKISIDSATLMNKGFEVIEAQVLFDFPLEKIEILIHPQSIVHALVKLIDGSYLAHLSWPDMKIPIAYALTLFERIKLPVKELNLEEIGTLTFEKPDFQKFPCLRLAYEAVREGNFAPLILEAADEVVVSAFLERKITFDKIPYFLEKTLKEFKINFQVKEELEDILFLHQEVCQFTKNLVEKGS
ncbi:MAG: 1-deoxy-D-xylulose-5-phosphate reductoisomerase [Thermodesulfobacteriaceae bacterium]|nr:1-deoxy-D-xylulose-5-phosphate reductoisomerase [Thermodesulfobacteriaceae bacterium]MCX8042260.1 1-deoxy-D-xylulose-5-phosphate reductoisomerase [Thermodesulfobacteriaceae bacterium]MDW8136690.1 1-deoxy-D-xylulose-5-phosphate reductoisomerase [Thermodesulfobacterium sp.]